MVRKEILFVGWVNSGKKPVDGETTKNQYIIAELEKYCDVKVLDFYRWKSHPWIYVQAAWNFLTKPNATIIFSTSASNVYLFLKLINKLDLKRNIIHWVIGGSFAKQVKEGLYDANVFSSINFNLVQCKGMIDELNEAGVMNAKFVSNFKPIKYYPDLAIIQKHRKECEKMRFVFMSRIMPDKGCDYILEAVEILNKQGLQNKYIVDFYGKVDPAYKRIFEHKVSLLPNVNYYGLLDLKSSKGYDTLSSYHAMLFPTFHPSEGIAGVIIDAYIAGLPVIASDWAHNPESVQDGKTGVLIATHDVDALVNIMKKIIDGLLNLDEMSVYAQNAAHGYDAQNAITPEYLKEINLL